MKKYSKERVDRSEITFTIVINNPNPAINDMVADKIRNTLEELTDDLECKIGQWHRIIHWRMDNSE